MKRNILLKEFLKTCFIKVTNTVSIPKTDSWLKQKEGKSTFAALGTDLERAAVLTPWWAVAGGQELAWTETGLRGRPGREASHTHGTLVSPQDRATLSPEQRNCLQRSVRKESKKTSSDHTRGKG